MATPALALERVTIGYFPEWPTPNILDIRNNSLARETGVEFVWRAFEMGQDINRAMANGEVQIAYSQEFVSFLNGVSEGNDYLITGIALNFPGYDSCVVSGWSGISRDNAKELEGQRVATLPATVSHFRLLKILEHLEVDARKVAIAQYGDGANVAKAVRYKKKRSIDRAVMGCAYGAPVESMLERGSHLLSPEEMDRIGLRSFDVVVMNRAFLDEHHDLAQAFMDMTADANREFLAHPDSMRVDIAVTARMSLNSSNRFFGYFQFPTPQEQASPDWLGVGGVVEQYGNGLARFLQMHGKIESVPEDFSKLINTGLLH